jgi:hypothetical protein
MPPVSSARPGGGGLLVYMPEALLASAIVWNIFRQRARTRLIRHFAESRKLTYAGATMSATLPLHRIEALRWARSIKRSVTAINGNKELIFFDCTVGGGRRCRKRTVVAARGQVGGFGWAQFGPDLKTEKAGEWMFVYGSNRLLSIEELDALLSEFSAPSKSAN